MDDEQIMDQATGVEGEEQGLDSGAIEQPATDSLEGNPEETSSEEQIANALNLEEFAYKYKGEQRIPKSKEDIITALSKNHSLNEQYAQLKAEQERIKQESEKYSKYGQFDEMLRQNPQLFQQVMGLMQKHKNGLGDEQEELPGYVNKLLSKIDELETKLGGVEKFRQASEAEKQDAALDAKINELRDSYKSYWDDATETELLDFALKNNFNDLDYAAKSFFYDKVVEDRYNAGMKAAEEKRKAQAKAGVVANGNRPEPKQEDPYDKPASSLNEAFKRMSEELS